VARKRLPGDLETLLEGLERRMEALERRRIAEQDRPQVSVAYLAEVLRVLDESCQQRGEDFEEFLEKLASREAPL
jgi:hypothetical protein